MYQQKKQHPSDNCFLSTSSIAIVGASYAGLTLANYIRLYSPNAKVKIFESKSSLTSNFIQGFFEVPNYRHVLKQIQLDYNGSSRREIIIHTLWNDRVKPLIESNQEVLKVQYQYPSKSLYILSRTGGSNLTKRYGPFDIVIGADGVLSSCRKYPFPGVLVIGDARWAQDRWYDFGYLRINAGGDIAMRDACELGGLLCFPSRIHDGVHNSIGRKDLNKFKVVYLQQRACVFKTSFFILVWLSYLLLRHWFLYKSNYSFFN